MPRTKKRSIKAINKSRRQTYSSKKDLRYVLCMYSIKSNLTPPKAKLAASSSEHCKNYSHLHWIFVNDSNDCDQHNDDRPCEKSRAFRFLCLLKYSLKMN